MDILLLTYWLGVIYEIILRTPLQNIWKKAEKIEKRTSATETILLGLIWVVMIVFPLLYSITNLIEFADYVLPPWFGVIGIVLLILALIVFTRAHFDLKHYWSPTLEIMKDHKLVTNGIYKYIRHPIYASQWIWVIAQILLIQNYIAGPIDLLFFIPFYLLRVRSEEKMMIEVFGKEYREYMKRTGGIFPKMGN